MANREESFALPERRTKRLVSTDIASILALSHCPKLMTMAKSMNIFLIGFGNMGEAIAKTLGEKKQRYTISVSDRNENKLEKAAVAYGVKPNKSFSALNKADIIILAVKPQDLGKLAGEIKNEISEKTIIISIAAGANIQQIQKLFGCKKIVRVMPSIGLLVGEGISAWKSSFLPQDEKEKVQELLDDLSDNFEVGSEELIDAVTAISGSGPAYFFLLAQQMETSAEALGLDEKQARRLVEKTLSAAAALQKDKSYEQLIRSVASRGGTTEAALKVLEDAGFSATVLKAAEAAHKRSQELSGQS